MKGMTGENLMTLLESRLDNVVFRMGFARTRREARQIVDHKHVLVNGKCVNIPSYLIKAGDVIEIKESAKSMQRYKDILDVTAGRLVPEWIDADVENFKGTIKNLPTRETIDVPVDEMLIVELYSSKFYVTPMNISCGILFHGILFVRTCQHIKFAKEGIGSV